MLSVQEALQQILQTIQPVSTEEVRLHAAYRRVLAEDIQAEGDLPAFDNSSVDGFALKAADTVSAGRQTPLTLRVVADIPAGTHPNISLQPGQAARIMTGAVVPQGADAVIMVEDTDFGLRDAGTPPPPQVQIYKPIQPGENTRVKGTDIRAGQVVLQKGSKLGPAALGLLATLGLEQVAAHRPPRVALLSSGDELVPAGQPLRPGQIHDSNSPTLSALIHAAGAIPLPLGIAADQRDAVEQKLSQAIEQRADVIISSAGVSVGAFDYIKSVVEENGKLDFWRVNIRPGKPLAFGNYRGIPFFGLPGNPVSSYIGFEVFVRPALAKLSGETSLLRRQVTAILAEAIESDGRESYLRATVHLENGDYIAHQPTHQGSGNLYSLVLANALLIIPSGVKSLAPGARVKTWLLET